MKKLLLVTLLFHFGFICFGQQKQSSTQNLTFMGTYKEGVGDYDMGQYLYTFKGDKGEISFCSSTDTTLAGVKGMLIICRNDSNGMFICSSNPNSVNKKFKIIYKKVHEENCYGNSIISITQIKWLNHKIYKRIEI